MASDFAISRSVSAGASELEELLVPLLRGRVIAHIEGHGPRAVQQLRLIEGGRPGCFERMHEVVQRLAKESAHEEEVPGGADQLDLQALVVVAGPADRPAEVLQLGVEASQPLRCGRSAQFALGARHQAQAPLCMSLEDPAGLQLFREALGGELADRLQHPEAVARVAQQALLDERLEDVEVGVADVFGGVERAPAGEDGEAGEELLLVFGEQVV